MKIRPLTSEEALKIKTAKEKANKALRGQRIDVFIGDVAKAREWGRRTVKVRVLE